MYYMDKKGIYLITIIILLISFACRSLGGSSSEPDDNFSQGTLEALQGTQAAIEALQGTQAAIETIQAAQPVVEQVENTQAPVEESPSEQTMIRQWATSATASSEYSDVSYSAQQALGVPDTPECGDIETAWASFDGSGVEWLDVRYEIAVVPTEIIIYQTHTPDQIVEVQVIDTSEKYHTVYTGTPHFTDCPLLNSILVDLDFEVIGVKITVDQSVLDPPWDEIDAVELIGYASEPTGETPSQDQTQGDSQGNSNQPPVVVPPFDLASMSWTTYTTENGLTDDIITALEVDADGTVWVGNGNTGVNKFDGSNWFLYGKEEGLGTTNGNDFTITTDGTLWVATGWGAATIGGASITNYTTDQGLVSNSVTKLAAAPDGSIWFGSNSSGLSHFDGSTWTTYTSNNGLINDYIQALAVDSTGGVWVGTREGLSYFDGNRWTNYTEADGLPYKSVKAVAVAPDGAVWVGTGGQGAAKFDGSTWTSYRDDEGLAAYYVEVIVVAPDGALWFGTSGNGVYRYDGQSWLNLTEADGLAMDWIDAIAISLNGDYWFGTRGSGLSHLAP